MRSYIALLPGIIAVLYLFVLFQKNAKAPVAKAFLMVYLPAVLLFPYGYKVTLPVLPDPGFQDSAIIPIFAAYLIFPNRTLMQTKKGIRILDFLVFFYVIICVLSEYYNTGMFESSIGYDQNLWRTVLYQKTLNILIPYYLARKLIHPNGMTHLFGKVLVFCILFLLVIGLYEWKMVVNPHYEILSHFFPEDLDVYWTPTYRYDLVRISGTFGHPILFGIGIAATILINHWITKNGFWKRNFSFLFLNSYIKGFAFGILLFLGLLMTFSRGPLYSSAFAFILLGLGYTRQRWLYLFSISTLLLIASFFIFQYIIYYSEIGRDVAESQQESTTIYRVGLIQAYIDFVQEKPWLGWGATTWPKAPKMESVDNQYLFILLTHGMIALSLYCCILLLASMKLFHKAMTIPSKFRENQSLSVTLLSILFMLGVTFITVYMAFQVEVLTFIFIGLAQGFLDTYPTRQAYVPYDEKKKTFLPALAH